MDIDPGQTKESTDLQSAQQNTNFFRDMLMLMQETYHQIEVIEQWGMYCLQLDICICCTLYCSLTSHRSFVFIFDLGTKGRAFHLHRSI